MQRTCHLHSRQGENLERLHPRQCSHIRPPKQSKLMTFRFIRLCAGLNRASGEGFSRAGRSAAIVPTAVARTIGPWLPEPCIFLGADCEDGDLVVGIGDGVPHLRHWLGSVRCASGRRATPTFLPSATHPPDAAPAAPNLSPGRKHRLSCLRLRPLAAAGLAPRDAPIMQRAHRALRRSRRANGCAQLHHGLIEVAGAFAVEQSIQPLPRRFPSPGCRQTRGSSTRSTLPSTTATASPNAMLAIAAAV